MVENKNEYVNKLLKTTKKETSYKFYYKRTGSCNWKKCQAACCRFECVIGDKNKNKKQYLNDFNHIDFDELRRLNGYDVYLKAKLCSHITVDGKCVLHNSKLQPRVCTYFPMHPDDGMYISVEHVCGYKFKKLKNPYYNLKKEKIEETKSL